MRVGVPKEIKVQEYRVGLTPGAVREYVAAGHQVMVETGAAAASARPMRCIGGQGPPLPRAPATSLPSPT